LRPRPGATSHKLSRPSCAKRARHRVTVLRFTASVERWHCRIALRRPPAQSDFARPPAAVCRRQPAQLLEHRLVGPAYGRSMAGAGPRPASSSMVLSSMLDATLATIALHWAGCLRHTAAGGLAKSDCAGGRRRAIRQCHRSTLAGESQDGHPVAGALCAGGPG